MMDKCVKCNQPLEEGLTKCPNCGEKKSNNSVIQEVIVDFENEINDRDKVVKTHEQPTEEQQTLASKNNIGIVPFEENTIANELLETVSVDVNSLILEEEKTKETIIEIPDMPEPEIAEINPELLGKNYDEEERINNEKIEAKRQRDLAELERKRQEEEEKKQRAALEGKPDLLAGRSNGEIPTNYESKTKRKKRKFKRILLIIFILALIGFGLYFFLVLRENL